MTITEKDLIGDLRDFPVEVVQRMIECQVEQGNKANVKIFQLDKETNKSSGGFDWIKTKEHGERKHFWCDVIRRKEFNVFFKMYPKQVEKKYKIDRDFLSEGLRETGYEMRGSVHTFIFNTDAISKGEATESQIKQVHSWVCNYWKKRIEEQFPEIFAKEYKPVSLKEVENNKLERPWFKRDGDVLRRFVDHNVVNDPSYLPTEELANKMFALQSLLTLHHEWTKDLEWNKDGSGYAIALLIEGTFTVQTIYKNVKHSGFSFPSYDLAEEFMNTPEILTLLKQSRGL